MSQVLRAIEENRINLVARVSEVKVLPHLFFSHLFAVAG